MLEEKIPATYVGIHEVLLKGGKPLDGNGNPRKTNKLLPGETIMMPADEVLGMSYLREKDTLTYLGAGYVVLPEDQTKTPEELAERGYEFSEGRSDFEPTISEHLQARVPKATPKPTPAQDLTKRRPIVVPAQQAPTQPAADNAEQAQDSSTSEQAGETSAVPIVPAAPSSSPSEVPVMPQHIPTEGE